MRLIYISIMFFVSFGLGMAVAHYSLPEKARMSQETAKEMLDKKYHSMGYLKSEGVK